MDQKRLMLAIAVSIAILLGFQFLVSPHLPHPPAPPPAQVANNQATGGSAATPAEGSPGAGGQTTQPAAPKVVPRVTIDAARLQGSISRVGARIDDLVLTDYRETQDPNSPDVRLLEPLEQSRLCGAGDADAGVGDVAAQARPGGRRAHAGADGHRARLGELHGVADEVEQALTQPRGIGQDPGRERLHLERELQSLGFPLRPKHLDDAGQQRGRIGGSRLDPDLASVHF